MKSYKAPNEQIIIAQDEIQAAAFEKAGLEPVDGAKQRKTNKE